MSRIIYCLLLVTIMLGCAGSEHQTLADLKYKPEQEKEIVLEQLSHEEVRKEYQELLSLFKDDELKEQIERRIADVYMIESGESQLKAEPKKSYYTEAIKNYQNILEKYPNSPNNADVLYQLARAYDMEGNQKQAMKMLIQLTKYHPAYENNAEAHFRMGDIYFSRKEYRNAENEFNIVTQYQNPELMIYARYMLGWANYKQLDYDESLDAFAFVLNQLMAKSKTSEALTKTEKPLIKDTIHSMSLALSKHGGAETIEKIARLQNQPHIWMVYNELGDYYLEKERYEDSAKTYRLYVNKYNYAEKAPELHHKLIQTYIKGSFPLLALKEKESYVEFYGLGSDYVKNVGKLSDEIRQHLKVYIEELAQHYHNQGQGIQKSLAKLDKALEKDKSKEKTVKLSAVAAKRHAELSEKEIIAFNRAAHFYTEYLKTFPNDEKFGEMTYLRAEVLFQAERFADAIRDYEAVAYEIDNRANQSSESQAQSNPVAKFSADAGYAAIISYQKHIDQITQQGSAAEWQAKAVESMLRFATKFHNDKRSPTVLTNAAEYLFTLNEFARALQVAGQLVANNPKLDATLKKTAYGIMAHSNFKLEQYQAAEDNYINQRALTKQGSDEYKKITERLATAIYKKSEQLIAIKQSDTAIEQLLKITKLAPDSSVRVTAQYDATRLLLSAKRWDESITQLTQLIELFPKYVHAQDIKRKLAFAYEQNTNWTLAAEHYLTLSKKDPDEEVRRDSLFLAAKMNKNSKNYETSIKLFKRYARTYEQPFAVRMEARYNLADLYEKTDDISKQLFWLRRIIEGDAKGGEQRNSRSRWLGAWANVKYGDYFSSEFKKRRLTLPLAKSLPKKNKALSQATQRYQKAADYGILEFVTMTSVKTADLYQTLVAELRKSPVPKGLSGSEVSAYREIIEEQAAPLMEAVLELHEGNVMRAWEGEFDEWIEKSFIAMGRLYPERFAKTEVIVSYGDEIW
ncbi:tetratricopeptide repeat protein [Aliikangiella coralliicola]|uniref:Tetratricopeptide repeat protein n=1 Tax=Aliikangiella coralliicola TaxID=2592383 RepID=A0A545U017_9GAMM|nr:tetratricopeptide repeat protein [Aliikangiella coralliicola]TQV82806.1 tetratricopeptide repeat protein [Aliikangiella coralliicola]